MPKSGNITWSIKWILCKFWFLSKGYCRLTQQELLRDESCWYHSWGSCSCNQESYLSDYSRLLLKLNRFLEETHLCLFSSSSSMLLATPRNYALARNRFCQKPCHCPQNVAEVFVNLLFTPSQTWWSIQFPSWLEIQ